MKLSLNQKVTGFIVFMMLIISLISSYSYVSAYRVGLVHELTARGITMAESLAMSVDEALAAEDVDLISHIKKISYAHDVILAQVYSTLWLAFDSYPAKSADIPPDPAAVEHFKNNQTSFYIIKDDHIDFYSPVFFHLFSKSNDRKYNIGYVRLQLSSEQAKSSMRKMVRAYAFICVLVTIGTILVLTTFVRKMVIKPLHILQQAVSKSVNEELPEPVPVNSADEIGELSQSFNTMCEGLRHREMKLREQTVVLEKEIAQKQIIQDELHDQAIALKGEVSERQQAERELQLYRDSLEDLVKERTVQLAAANKELEAFAYSVSHDLRAPLRGIDGFSLALLEEYGAQLDDTGRNYLDRVRKGCDKMGSLIDDILHLSRLTRADMHREYLDMSDMANAIVNDLREASPERAVEVIITPDIRCTADAPLLRAAMTNLLSNAWKFTRKTEYARIEFGAIEQNGVTCFFVRDNGAGFDMQYVDKLFGAFQRLHHSSDFEGSGIGLATVQRIIHRHGGHIRAEGKPSEGATFYFTLEGDRK